MEELTIGPNLFRFDGRALNIRDAFGQQIVCWLDRNQVEALQKLLSKPADEGTNRRRSFRAPVAEEFDVQSSIGYRGQWYDVQTHNISLTGILVEYDDPSLTDCGVDSTVQVKMAFEGYHFEGNGIVRRHEDRRLGILFPDLLKGNQVMAPSQLMSMVMDVQRRWVQRKGRMPK